jgi:hypothetical protein
VLVLLMERDESGTVKWQGGAVHRGQLLTLVLLIEQRVGAARVCPAHGAGRAMNSVVARPQSGTARRCHRAEPSSRTRRMRSRAAGAPRTRRSGLDHGPAPAAAAEEAAAGAY